MELDDKNWVSIVDYARMFNVSDMTVRRRIKTGKIPAELLNGKYYIPREEVERRNAKNSNKPSIRERTVSPYERPTFGRTGNIQSEQRERTNGSNVSALQNKPSQNYSMNASNDYKLIESVPVEFNEAQHSIGAGFIAPSNSGQARFPSSETRRSNEADRSIIELCKDTMRLARESEEKSKSLFEEKLLLFKEKEKNYKLQIQSLEQKVEDLELLVSVLESKIS